MTIESPFISAARKLGDPLPRWMLTDAVSFLSRWAQVKFGWMGTAEMAYAAGYRAAHCSCGSRGCYGWIVTVDGDPHALTGKEWARALDLAATAKQYQAENEQWQVIDGEWSSAKFPTLEEAFNARESRGSGDLRVRRFSSRDRSWKAWETIPRAPEDA